MLQQIQECSGAEGALLVFNILYPFEGRLPPPQGEQAILTQFYGEDWTVEHHTGNLGVQLSRRALSAS